MIGRIVLSLGLTAVCVSAAAPQLVSQEWYTHPLKMQDGEYDLLVGMFEFDQDLYLKSMYGGVEGIAKYADIQGYEDQTPNITLAGAGLAKMTCAGTALPTDHFKASEETYPQGGGKDGPPTFLMAAPGTDEPHAALLADFGGGMRFDEPINAKRLALIRLISAHEYGNGDKVVWASEQQIKDCKPSFTFPGTHNASQAIAELQNKDGEVFSGTVTFDNMTRKEFKCTAKAVQAVQDIITQFFNIKPAGKKVAEQLKFTVGSIEARSGYWACVDIAKDMMDLQEEELEVDGDTDCHEEWGTMAHDADPCCNDHHEQCCVPKKHKIKVNKLKGVNDTVIQAECAHPKYIAKALSSYVAFEKLRDERDGEDANIPDDMGDAWDQLSVTHECSKQIEHPDQCESDSDCISNRCDEDTKQCVLKYDKLELYWAKCILKEAHNVVKKEIALRLKVDLKDRKLAIGKLANVFKQDYTSDTCVGREAWQFQERREWRKDAITGEWKEYQIAGNETGCLGVQSCNYNSWMNRDEASCVAGNRESFCGECSGEDCWPVNNPSSCTPALSTWDINCTTLAASLNSTTHHHGHGCMFELQNMTQAGCLSSGAAGTYCSASEKSNGHCQQKCVYIGNETYDATNCSNITDTVKAPDWDADISKCVYHYDTLDQCNQTGWDAFLGRDYDKGWLNTKALCEAPSCTVPWFNNTESTNQTLCEAAGQCSVGCFDANGNWEECTEQTCAQNGHCHAWDLFYHCHEKGDSNTECGACVGDFPSSHQCAGDSRITRLGCLYSNYTDKTTCETDGFTWYARPAVWNQTNCEALAQTCVDDHDRWQVNPKNQTECTTCGGTLGPAFEWEAGEWQPGEWGANYRWKKKAWKSINRWGKYVSMSKVEKGMEDILGTILARKIFNEARAKYKLALAILADVACDCDGTQNKDNGCTGQTRKEVLKSCSAEAGSAVSCGGITVKGNSSTVFDVVSIPSYTLLPDGETRRLRRRLLETTAVGAANEYAIIENANGGIVGQLLGNGLGLTLNETADIEICADADDSITWDSATYPTLDFSKADDSTNEPGPPLQITVQQRGTDYCANVTEGGTYFPIARVADADLTAVTASPSASPTAEPTHPPTEPGTTPFPTLRPTFRGETHSPTPAPPTNGPTSSPTDGPTADETDTTFSAAPRRMLSVPASLLLAVLAFVRV